MIWKMQEKDNYTCIGGKEKKGAPLPPFLNTVLCMKEYI